MQALQDRLQRLHFRYQSNDDRRVIIPLHCPPHATQPDSQAHALRTQLSVLCAIQLHIDSHPNLDDEPDSTESYVRVQLEGWAMTQGVMEALQGLPEWASTLDLMFCTWPLEPTQYKSLAQYVPTSCGVWRLHVCPGSALFKSMCEGVNERRARLELPPVTCVFPSQSVLARNVGEHVCMQ